MFSDQHFNIFTFSFGRLRQNNLLKCVPHVRRNYSYTFHQSRYWFVALQLHVQHSFFSSSNQSYHCFMVISSSLISRLLMYVTISSVQSNFQHGKNSFFPLRFWLVSGSHANFEKLLQVCGVMVRMLRLSIFVSTRLIKPSLYKFGFDSSTHETRKHHCFFRNVTLLLAFSAFLRLKNEHCIARSLLEFRTCFTT